MAESIQNVYGTALYELCEEQGILSEVYEQLTDICKIIFDDVKNADFAKLMCSNAVSKNDKKQALTAVFSGKLDDTVIDFLCLLADKGRFGYLPEICKCLKDKYNAKMNIMEVLAITAQPLSENLRQKLVAKLEKVSGKKIVLSEKIDKSIMGGISIRYEKTEIDATVKSGLEKLRKQINGIIA